MIREPTALLLFGLLATCAQALELNTATMRQLERLDGIGTSLARRITEERRRHGEFRHWDDLQYRVRGISELKAWELSDQGLTVAGESHRRVFVAKVPRSPKGTTSKHSPSKGNPKTKTP